MLKLANDFLQPEIREEFTIDTTMKTVWAAGLEVLNEIAKVCSGHGLTWYMAFGSLLGAVRHEGFVPWDDDIDICLKREDYMELLRFLPNELPEGYIVKSPLLDTGYAEYQTCVLNSDSISIEPEHLHKFHGCPFVVGVDIFPLDYIPDEEVEPKDSFCFQVFGAARQAVLMIKNEEPPEQIAAVLDALEKHCDVTIERTFIEHPESKEAKDELISGLWGLANEIAMSACKTHSACLVMYSDYYRFNKRYEAAWFEKVEYLPFEGLEVPVPEGYDNVLRVVYGNYEVRYRNTALHDYPFYKEQVEQLRKRLAEYEMNQKVKNE